jgi:hypothetical protein
MGGSHSFCSGGWLKHRKKRGRGGSGGEPGSNEIIVREKELKMMKGRGRGSKYGYMQTMKVDNS